MHALRAPFTAVALCSLLAAPFASPLAAQTTWIVDMLNGPGANFTDLPPALAVAVHGDTILVRPGAYSGGTTDQGIAIVAPSGAAIGDGQQLVVQNVPAGRTFRMVGFTVVHERFQLQVSGCQGAVHLDRLKGREQPPFPNNVPGFQVSDCTLVTFNDCDNFGTPSMSVARSRVLLTRCYLGLTSIAVGGGQCLVADASTVEILEPMFDGQLAGTEPAVKLTNCTATITGSSRSFVQGNYSGQPQANAAVHLEGGTLLLDPSVQLNPTVVAPQAITGTGTVVRQPVPATLALDATAGRVISLFAVAPPGTPVGLAISAAAAPTPTPLGTSWLDWGSVVVLPGSITPATGVFAAGANMPTWFPPGVPLTFQGFALLPGSAGFTAATVLVSN